MRRALAVAFALVVLSATPALAQDHAHHVSVHPAPAADMLHAGGDEHGEAVDAESDGENGTDPAEFAALLVAGVAAVAAMAALIFATKRAPA